MRIALISEGCYPFARGGVTTWCDQLVRGLPQHEFEVVGLLGDGSEPLVVPLPANVTAVRRIPLWGPPRRARAPRWGTWSTFEPAFGLLLSGILGDHPGALGDVVTGCGGCAGRRSTRPARSARQRAGRPHGPGPLERLVPLRRQPPDAPARRARRRGPARALPAAALGAGAEVDMCHAVSNGLSTLVAMAAKWRYGTPLVMSEHGIYLRERYISYLHDDARMRSGCWR